MTADIIEAAQARRIQRTGFKTGTVRKKNQVNALVKILVDFSVSTVVYFAVGYGVAYGTHFFVSAEELAAKNGYELGRVRKVNGATSWRQRCAQSPET